jgi:hypothetical protein
MAENKDNVVVHIAFAKDEIRCEILEAMLDFRRERARGIVDSHLNGSATYLFKTQEDAKLFAEILHGRAERSGLNIPYSYHPRKDYELLICSKKKEDEMATFMS